MTEDRTDKDKRLLDWLSRRLNLSEIFSFFTGFGLFNTELDTGKAASPSAGRGDAPADPVLRPLAGECSP